MSNLEAHYARSIFLVQYSLFDIHPQRGLPKFDGGSRFEFMHPEAVEAQIKAIRAMSVEDKLCVAESLRAFAWEVKRASLARQHPDLSHTERHERVRAAFRNGHA